MWGEGWRNRGRGKHSASWMPVVTCGQPQDRRAKTQKVEQEKSGRRRVPSNQQQLEWDEGRERGSVAHRREGGEERAWALMKSSLDVKEGGKSGSLSSDHGDKR